MSKRKVGITQKTVRAAEAATKRAVKDTKTKDSYQNFSLNLGLGTDNALSGSTYGFNPVTRNRTLMEWIHRGSWMGGVAVDVVAEDMTRAGIDIVCDNPPEDVDAIQQTLVSLGVWQGITDTVKWSRLYGGSIGVMMVDGQDVSTPLDPDKVGKDQFRGILPMDRWMLEPSLNDLVTEQGPQIGLPKFYSTASNTSGYKFTKIHYSRVIRLEGIRLPYWQRVSENLWGISVLERLYDRMVAFDSATTGAAQLAYKSFLRTYNIDNLREIIAAGGDGEAALIKYVDMMRRFQGIEGITLLDAKDDMVIANSVNMTGMSDALLQFGQQLSGALQIPLVRLFGQSPAGLNSTGESDLRTYYDGIAQQQGSNLLVPMKNVVKMTALSKGIKLKEFTVTFRPLWQLSEEQKSEVAARDATSIMDAEERGLITQQTAMKELKNIGKTTGRFTNVTDEDIKAASDDLAPRGEEALEQQANAMGGAEGEGGGDDEDKNDPKEPKGPKPFKDATAPQWPRTTRPNGLSLMPPNPDGGISPAESVPDRARDSLPTSQWQGLDIAIETLRGQLRHGQWVQPADYGYIRRMPSAEGREEWMDCFVSPAPSASGDAYVIDGYTPEDAFDEHKVMLGFDNAQAALDCYHQAYGDGRRAGGITPMSVDRLRAWCQSGDVTRPLAAKNLRLAANGGIAL
jgi:phage-related protein (TIGR01555 family)